MQMGRMVGLQVTHYHAITICSFQRMIGTIIPGVVVNCADDNLDYHLIGLLQKKKKKKENQPLHAIKNSACCKGMSWDSL